MLQPGTDFVLGKREWDSISLERVKTATDPTQYADIAAMVMGEGSATLCLITPSMTITRAKIGPTSYVFEQHI